MGNAPIGPLQSIRIMHGSFWRAVVLVIAAALRVMALDYVLGDAAIHFGTSTFDWALMNLESFVTGFLAMAVTQGSVADIQHAAEK